MPKSTEARIAANARYNQEHVKQFKIGLNKSTDADIIAKLEQLKNEKKSQADYVKKLIRKDNGQEIPSNVIARSIEWLKAHKHTSEDIIDYMQYISTEE